MRCMAFWILAPTLSRDAQCGNHGTSRAGETGPCALPFFNRGFP